MFFALFLGTTGSVFAQTTKAEIENRMTESLALFQTGDTLGALRLIEAIDEQEIENLGDTIQWKYYDHATALNLFCGNEDKALKYLNLIIPLQEKSFSVHADYYYLLQKQRFEIEYRRGNNDRALIYLQELLVRCNTVIKQQKFESDRKLLQESLDLLLKLNGIEL